MKSDVLEKLETAQNWIGLQRGQRPSLVTMLDNWAICAEILEQIIGEEYERIEEKKWK